MWNPFKKYQYHEEAKQRLAEHLLVAEFKLSKGITGKADAVLPTFHLEILIRLGRDQYDQEGYIFEIDDTFKNIVGGKYIHTTGKGKYSEVQLKKEDIDILKKYYKIDELDMWHEFHKKIVS